MSTPPHHSRFASKSMITFARACIPCTPGKQANEPVQCAQLDGVAWYYKRQHSCRATSYMFLWSLFALQIRGLCRKQFFARALGMRIAEHQCRPPAPPSAYDMSNLRHARNSSPLHSYPVAVASASSMHHADSWQSIGSIGSAELLNNPLAANH